MPKDDGWDWPWLFYAGTVVLKMSEQEFWCCQPRRLQALLRVHSEVHGKTDTNQSSQNSGYIDQVL